MANNCAASRRNPRKTNNCRRNRKRRGSCDSAARTFQCEVRFITVIHPRPGGAGVSSTSGPSGNRTLTHCVDGDTYRNQPTDRRPPLLAKARVQFPPGAFSRRISRKLWRNLSLSSTSHSASHGENLCTRIRQPDWSVGHVTGTNARTTRCGIL